MKDLSEIFEGGTLETQKKRKITFYCICVTLALIAVMLVILAVFGVVTLIVNNSSNEPAGQEIQVSIGATIPSTFDADQLYSGTLLILDDNHKYQGKTEFIILRNAENRPKTSTGGHAYSILSKGATDELDFRGSPEAVDALHLMIKEFYMAKGDDNLCIVNAFTKANADTIDPIYASGNSFAFNYYFEYPGEDKSIYGVDKYSWIYNNAHKYGFINVETGEESGSNVFRYVGIPHATYMRTKKLDLEAYIELLKSATPEAPLLTKIGKYTYASYFIADGADQVVPADYNYTVSGNNSDGYIITAIITKKAAS
jgi:hypothetical protein